MVRFCICFKNRVTSSAEFLANESPKVRLLVDRLTGLESISVTEFFVVSQKVSEP